MSSRNLYTHKFTWPPTPSSSVIVTGTFDNWSGERHHLRKNESNGGYWEGEVEIPFGERIAYKYVVDGHWLIREDEEKEWDAAGNMNNIFAAPASQGRAAEEQHSSATPAVAGAAVVGAGADAVAGGAAASSASTATPRSPSKTEHASALHSTSTSTSAPTSTSTAGNATGTSSGLAGGVVEAPTPAPATLEREKAQDAATHDHHADHTSPSHAERREDGHEKESLKDKAKGLVSSFAPGAGVAAGNSAADAQIHARDSGRVGPDASRDVHTTGISTGSTGTTGTTAIGLDVGSNTAHVGTGSTSTSASRNVAEFEAGKVVVGESTKAGSDLLGGLALGAPIGGGASPSYGGHHTTTTAYSSAPTTTSNLTSTSGLTGTAANSTRDVNTSTGSAVHTGPTTISNNPEASSHTASTGSTLKTGSTDNTHVDAAAAAQHEPSSPLKDLAAATSPILGSSAGSTSNAAHLAAKETGEKISAHHDPADALKELADATKPVFGSSAGTTTAHAHEEIKAIDQTPAQPLKQLADATAPYGSSTTSSATADKVRESSASAPNVPTSAQTAEHQEGLAETVSHFGSSALAALGAAATGIVVGANEAVHSATGLDLLHNNPMSVQEAKEKGIDTTTGQPIESTTATTGSAVPATSAPAAAGSSVPSASVIAAPATSAATTSSATSSYAQWSKGPQGLGAPIGGSASGPSPAAFAAPASSGVTQAAPLGTARGPTPAEVGGVATTTTHPAPVAAVVVPVAGQHSQQHSSADKVASNTDKATASRPTESKQVDVFSSNTPDSKDKDPKGNDILGQEETRENNHKKVPQPMITNIGQPTKDRTKPSPTEEAGTQMSSRPDADPKQAALNEERNKRNGAIEGVPSRSYAKPADTNKPLAGLPLGATQQPLAQDVAPATPTKASSTGPIATAPAPATPVTPLPSKAGEPVIAVATPATPASRVADRESRTLPGTPSSTTSSTPGSGHRKEESTDSMRKRKSSFFAKIKGAFHKDKKA